MNDRAYFRVTVSMRVTRKQATINKQKIVDSAIRLFAERGVNGVGLAEVMADAGFTHGGFYNHFASKDDLVLEASSTAFARAVNSLRNIKTPRRARDADFAAWLSPAMLNGSSKGSAALSAISAKGVSEFLDILTARYGDRDRAAAALAGLVGARIISSAVEQADKELSNRFGAVEYPTGG
jgi:TetR/AcrR family transcriptional regulator, transcriptional repressor for nem operon